VTWPWLLWILQLKVCTESDPPVDDPDNPPAGMWCLGRMPSIPEMQNQYDPVADTISHWVAHNGCAPSPQSQTIGEVDIETYACPDPGAVIFYRVNGRGHVWPGLQPSSCCEPNRATTQVFIANDVIWEFFRDKTL
jgi:poly(3-hydroxybutyrate) depolymerase